MAKVSEEKADEIRRVFAETGDKAETARRVGVSRQTVIVFTKSMTPGGPPEDPEARRQRLAELARERELLREVEGERSFRSFLERLVAEQVRGPITPAPPPPKPKNPKAHKRYPYLSLNDWHFEEVVKGEGVLGLNEYDVPTACRRVHRVVGAVREWKQDIEAGGRFTIPELVVGLNGDFLTGTLHGLERHSGAPNVVRAALACGDLISLAIADLARDFPKIRVVGTVGNHGRLPDDRKVPTKDPTRSWDYLAYSVARRQLASRSHVSFHLPASYGVLFEVGPHLCYQAHGNFIPQQLGIIGYGIRRFAANLAANISAAKQHLKYAFFGHWHSSNAAEFAGIKAFVNPSLIGTQEYGFLSNGGVSKAAQEMHLFDEHLGHVTTECFYGDGPGPAGTYDLDEVNS